MINDINIKYFVHKKCNDSWYLSDKKFWAYDLTFVLDGSAIFSTDEGSFNVSKGNAFITPKGSKRFATTQYMECVAISFDMPTDDFPINFNTLIHFNNDPIILGYFSEFEKSYPEHTEISKLKCQGLFSLILARILEITERINESEYVYSIKKFIIANIDKNITSEDIGQEVGLNSAYCGRIFKTATGQSIPQYINTIKIGKALSLLSFGNSSINEIASQCGYCDANYFSRTFKNIVGISPKKYQKK